MHVHVHAHGEKPLLKGQFHDIFYSSLRLPGDGEKPLLKGQFHDIFYSSLRLPGSQPELLYKESAGVKYTGKSRLPCD